MTKRSIDAKPKDIRPYWQQILDEIKKQIRKELDDQNNRQN